MDSRSDQRIPLGFGDLFADPGDHIGHFYRTLDELREVIVPFLRIGLDGKDKCVCVVGAGEPEAAVLEGLEAAGVDTRRAIETGQLVVTNGFSEMEPMERLLAESLADIPQRFQFLRWTGDMTWSHSKIATSESLMEWECACNIMEKVEAVFLCNYELSQFMGDVVVDALRTHPVCIVGGTIQRNGLYESPEEFLELIRQREATPLAPR